VGFGEEMSMLASERRKSSAKIPVCIVEDHCDVSFPLLHAPLSTVQ